MLGQLAEIRAIFEIKAYTTIFALLLHLILLLCLIYRYRQDIGLAQLSHLSFVHLHSYFYFNGLARMGFNLV